MSVFCLSASPTFGDFIADIDPSLSLDWNNRDFRGLPELPCALIGWNRLCKMHALRALQILPGSQHGLMRRRS
ncbi:hypothetical protein RLO149_p940430 (plasmid) [Roseobacter litoralis Och 149]|uniref:Uncharacterized protein n=1 Tax=Roseobacter litoralis (strain ATCC 49566 / DSM 6996 / JCM 21268 / NBRC 15278 / OCh 149) TaxID=391595 RepID=F7ZM51_ROSLO|nr:hypothetical protein RLO149_p940430 [Roseobacter litoralis Och 149]